MNTDSDAARIVGIGYRLTRVVLHDDGKFYRESDKTRSTPIAVSPIKSGVIRFWRQGLDLAYRPGFEEELNFELGQRVSSLAREEEIDGGQIGVRCQGQVVEFYKIFDPAKPPL
jgi:hypothetical protein